MSNPRPDVRVRGAWLAAIVVVGALTWANSLDGVFLYDDFDAIRDNVHLTRLWPPSEPMSLAMIHTGDTVSGRPILSLSFAVNRALLGPDIWPYGFQDNLEELAAMTRYSHAQGLAVRELDPAELFHPTTRERARV